MELYQAGVFELQRNKRPGNCSPDLLAYCNREDWRVTEARAKRQYQEKLSRLDELTEADFTYTLLNDLFWKHKGKGEATLQVGPIQVEKRLQAYASNSGKSRDFAVTFTWKGLDGQVHVLEKPSQYQSNRRNDAQRDWGLPG